MDINTSLRIGLGAPCNNALQAVLDYDPNRERVEHWKQPHEEELSFEAFARGTGEVVHVDIWCA